MAIIIIGGGIGGLATALVLHRNGHTVEVYEAAPTIRAVGAGVVLGANVVKEMSQLGLTDALLAAGVPISGLQLEDEAGRPLLAVSSAAYVRRHFRPHSNLALRHADLQALLLAQLPAGVVHTGHTFSKYTLTSGGVVAHFANGHITSGNGLVAADGLHSAVRAQLLPAAQPRYAGYTCWRAVVPAPAGLLPPDGPNIFRETWGAAGRFGYVPVGYGQVYWFCCLNATHPADPALSAYTPTDLARHFADFHPAVPALLAATPPAAMLWHDIVELPPLPRFAFGRVLLLGDAAHATTPNLGQGAGQALEDAFALAACFGKTSHPAVAFRNFEQRRRARTQAIARRSALVGQVAQLQKPALVAARNALLRATPDFVTSMQTKFIFKG